MYAVPISASSTSTATTMIRIDPRRARGEGMRSKRRVKLASLRMAALAFRPQARGQSVWLLHLEDVFDSLPLAQPGVDIDQIDRDADERGTNGVGVCRGRSGRSRRAGGRRRRSRDWTDG